MTDNLQGRNEQIINQIKTLQTTEMKLYDSLESRSLNSDQQKEIIDRINQISQMRINLYASLKDMYSYYQEDVSNSRNTMNNQMVSIDVIENELNDSKRRLNLLEAQKNNKIRLVEINTFYGKQYDAHKQIMQIVVIICIPVLILAVLANKGIIPPRLNALIMGIIIIIGLFINK
jgi:chromosome segregation ATPase